jgi:hypothetical protein
MTLAIAHIEERRVVLDCLLERKAPFSPEAAVAEFAGTLRAYRWSTASFSIGRWVRCGDRKRSRENQRRSDASQKSAMRCDEAGNQRSGANAVWAIFGSIFGCLFLFYSP